MLALAALALLVATAPAYSGPGADRTGHWWLRFSAPQGELDGLVKSSLWKVSLNQDAFPGATFQLCSTRSIAGLGRVRVANVTVALANAGVDPSRIRNLGDCEPGLVGQAFNNAESVLIVMERSGYRAIPSEENPAPKDISHPYHN